MKKDTNSNMLGSLLKLEEILKNKQKTLLLRFKKYIFSNFLLFLIIFFLLIIGSPVKNYLSVQRENLKEKYYKLETTTDSLALSLHFLENRDRQIFSMLLETDPYPVQTLSSFIGIKVSPDNLLYKKLDTLSKYLNIRKESYDAMMLSINDRNDIMESIPFMYPILDGVAFYISSKYGVRRDPIDSTHKFHYGYDFVGDKGTPIVSTGNGTVFFAGENHNGLGRTVKIRHGYGFETVYAHLDDIYVKVGDHVSRNEFIGTMGNTGRSTGTHLHYEIRKDGYAINPHDYINWNKITNGYEQMLAYL